MLQKITIAARVVWIVFEAFFEVLGAAWDALFKTDPVEQAMGQRLQEYVVEVQRPGAIETRPAPTPVKKLPSAFTLLGTSTSDHCITFETLYIELARDRLHKFGDIVQISTEKRWGHDTHGMPRPFIFVKARLDVSTLHSLDKATNRAKALENMELIDAFKLTKKIMERQTRNYAEELNSSIAVSGIPEKRTIVILTALGEFIYGLDSDICSLVHQESASEDNVLRRYYLQVPPHVDFIEAINYCIHQAQVEIKEVVTMGDLWDVWRNGDDI